MRLPHRLSPTVSPAVSPAVSLSLCLSAAGEGGENGEEAELPVISTVELLTATAAAKPSVSLREKARLDSIYADFLYTRSPADAAPKAAAAPKRATLA